MQAYYGNYLGLCINSDDPEQRGRVQVFVPHIMPALYDGWNKDLADKYIKAVGDNIEGALTSQEIEKLRGMLPWAEGAMPILGPCSPGTLTRGGDGSYAFNQAPTAYAGSRFGPATPLANPNEIVSDTEIPGVTLVGQQQGNGTRTRSSKIDMIVFHDTSGENGKLSDIRNVPGNYHYIVDRDGTVYRRNDDNINAPHAASFNGRSIGIAYRGLEGEALTPEAKNAMAKLTAHLVQKYNIPTSNLLTHPQGGKAATLSSGKDPREASWLPGVLASINLNGGGLFADTEDRLINRLGLGGKSEPEYIAGATPNPKTPTQMANADGPTNDGTSSEEWASIGGNPPPDQLPELAADTGEYDVPGSGGVAAMAPKFREQYERVYAALEGSKLIGSIPQGLQSVKYGVPNGSRAQWAHLFTRMVSPESSFNPNKTDGTKSYGLYQMGPKQFDAYGGQFGANHASGNWTNPDIATKTFVKYAEALYFGDNNYGKSYGGFNSIAGLNGGNIVGIAGGYGPLQKSITGVGKDGSEFAIPNTREREVLAENIAASEQMSYGNLTQNIISESDASQAVQIVQTKNPNMGPPVIDPNNRVGGALGVPAPGAVLWCFFREGNPQFPVYFAASYGAKEWSSAYAQTASPVPADTPSTPEQPVTSKGWNINYGGSGIYAQKTVDPNDTFNSGSQLTLYGEDGSHFHMGGRGYNEMVSRGDHALTVDKNLFETVRMNKELWVNGVNNMVIRGSNYKLVGNINSESIAAVKRIQKLIEDAYQPLINDT